MSSPRITTGRSEWRCSLQLSRKFCAEVRVSIFIDFFVAEMLKFGDSKVFSRSFVAGMLNFEDYTFYQVVIESVSADGEQWTWRDLVEGEHVKSAGSELPPIVVGYFGYQMILIYLWRNFLTSNLYIDRATFVEWCFDFFNIITVNFFPKKLNFW